MRKNFEEYQLYIFDMDGTLYFQRPMQLYMGISMLFGCLRPGGLKELRLVLEFRRQREKWKEDGDLDRGQYERLSEKWGMPEEKVEAVIKKWIYEEPLTALHFFRDSRLAGKLGQILEEGKTAVIYSDYPAEDKRKALGLPQIPCFYGGQPKIGAMKPDPKGIRVILKEMGTEDPGQALMIGDRPDRDGEAAKNAGVDYLIVKKSALRRHVQMKKIFKEKH